MPGLVKTQVQSSEAVAAASSGETLLRAPVSGTVTGVTYAPEGTITGANTNSRTLAVVNKGQDGAGAVAVASLALTSGVNAPGYDEKALTLNATPANLVVNAGDVLSLQSTAVGTGIADPGGLWTVSVTP